MKKKEGMVTVLVMLALASSAWLSAKAADDTIESKQNVRKCYKCSGKGTIIINTKEKCDNCDGTGVVVTDVVLKNKSWGGEWRDIKAKRAKNRQTCPKCNRSGKVNVKKEVECKGCKGAGFLTKGGMPYFTKATSSTNAVQTLADQIRANNVQMRDSSLKIAGDHGWAEFDYSANQGMFTIQGGGTEFVTMWSKCCAGTVYAHKDGVDMIGYRSGLNELPADSSGFPSYSWSSKKIAVKEGDVVVFMNKDSRFLAAKVAKVKNVDDGESSNSLHIEFKIY